jgi:4-hydroxybenzoyl-CoA reductase subunit alpha
MPIREAFVLAESRFGTLGAVGSYNTPKDVHGEYRGGTIGASPAYSFTSHVAEVDVDVDTGQVRVDRIWVAHDCGRALNPVLVEGQMEGSAYMGFGRGPHGGAGLQGRGSMGVPGLHNAPSLLDYRIPTSLDTPELISLIVESIDPEGPYGAKEAGEGPLAPGDPRHRERDLRRGRGADQLTSIFGSPGVAGHRTRKKRRRARKTGRCRGPYGCRESGLRR